jgi:AcrR family transcriptional regulator
MMWSDSTDKRGGTGKAVKKRQQILDAAAKIMRQEGYARTTVETIAREAGTQAGSMYYYFRSRDHIVEEVIRESMARSARAIQQCIAALPEHSSFQEKIRVAMRAHVGITCLDDDYLAAFRRVELEIPAELREKVLSAPRAFGKVWRSLLEEARDAGELRADLDLTIVRLLLIGSIIWTSRWYHPAGGKSAEEVSDILSTLFFEGIGSYQPRADTQTTTKKRNSRQAGPRPRASRQSVSSR